VHLRHLAAALALFVVATANAAEPAPFSAERSWRIQRLGAPTISPDGTTIVAPVTRHDLEQNKALTDL
jgi:hypothetical protein